MEWLWWVGGGLLLAIAEMLTLNLVALMLAGGAFGAAVAAALGVGLPGQVITAAVVSLLLLAALRPWLLRHWMARRQLPETNAAALVGRPAVVVAPTGSGGGRVKLAGEVWSARADGGEAFETGAEVVVARIEGATAVVTGRQQD